MNTGSNHTVAFDLDEEGKIFMLYEQVGDVEDAFKEGLGRRGKASVKRGKMRDIHTTFDSLQDKKNTKYEPTASFVVQDRQIKLAQAHGIGDRLDLSNLAVPDGEIEDEE